MVLFLGAAVNPNGLEIAAATCVWASALSLLARPSVVDRRLVLRLAISASVMVLAGDGVSTLAATDELASAADRAQGEVHEGPCFDALHQHEVIWSSDLADDGRWPLYGPRLIEETGTDSDTGGILYRTTELFLERLGLSSLADLPPIAPLLPEVDAIDDV